MKKGLIQPAIANALLAALLFGASTPVAKIALASANPLLVAGLLYLGSGVGLALSRVVFSAFGKNRPRREVSLRRADLPWLAGAILAGGVAAPALLLVGLSSTSASAASLLLNLEAVATAAIAWMVFRENVDRRVGGGFLCILLGGILLSLPHGSGVSLSSGALLIALACLCWGIDNNLTRKIAGSDSLQIAMWKGLIAGSVNFGLAFATGAEFPAATVTLTVALIGFLGYGVSLVLFVRALRDLGAARTSACFSTAPFAGATLAFAVGQGRLDWAFCAAGVLMLIGVWLHATERHEHLHVHESQEHEHLHFHDEHHRHDHGPDDPPGEPHAHRHQHARLAHSHAHYPDLHHRHEH
ncbi:MAG: DMT family transporter [Terrimicrobiaceae bacterium]|nr:DMT family transporter [Terrimicrobiaceae bacterium]